MLVTVILGLTAFALVILALIVVYSNYRSGVNRWLGLFIVCSIMWLMANLLANIYSHNASLDLLFTRITLAGSSLVPLTFVMFCVNFTNTNMSRRAEYGWSLPVLFLLLLTPTPLNVVSVDVGHNTFQPGPAYLLVFVILVVYFWYGTHLLIADYRRSSALRRQQLYYILLGVALSLLPGVLLDCVLPLLGYGQAAFFGPAATLALALFTTIAIARHGLLNVRLVIVRAISYASALAVLATLYGLLVFGAARWLFHLQISLAGQIWLSAATGLAALTFGYIRNLFDSLTNRLFYRDAYDPQELFDQLNKVLLSSLDSDYLLSHSIDIIASNLRAEFCTVALATGKSKDYEIFGPSKRRLASADLKQLFKLATRARADKNTVVTMQLEDEYSELQNSLQRAGVAVLVPLGRSTRRHEGEIGYLILGVKKSGNGYSTQDIRTLENVANELFIALQNAGRYEEIQNFASVQQQRVDDAIRRLRRSNEKLKELDEAKDDFVSMASHQLRTPLTSVKGYISMVLEGDAGPINDTQRKLLEQSFFSSQRMVYLIADLLNVSRLKTGKFVIEPSPVNLAEVVQEEFKQLRDTATSRQLELAYQMPEHFPALLLDETKTRQVIMNFMDNAIYYTPAGGHIRVELTDGPANIELRVIDDGIGVPRAERQHLFTKFYRAGNARKARPDGTGLGLFMAKKVVVAEGGAIIFETEEGKGSTFGFIFPKAKLAAPESFGTDQ